MAGSRAFFVRLPALKKFTLLASKKTILKMETVPPKPPNVQSVKTTRENLFVSSRDESCQSINYLEYIRQAKLDGNKHAIESFSLALAGGK